MYSNPQKCPQTVQSVSVRYPRSAQMINCLRQHFLYSEKRARDLLFQAVEDLVPTGPRMVSRLTREATARARLCAHAERYEFAAWEAAAKAVINSMLAAGVLLGPGGEPIRPGVAAQASDVIALQAGYRDITESCLLEFLIRTLGDVTTRDHTALAHALFRQFDPNIPMEDLEDRVAVLLARLAGGIALHPDGTYAACVEEAPLRAFRQGAS